MALALGMVAFLFVQRGGIRALKAQVKEQQGKVTQLEDARRSEIDSQRGTSALNGNEESRFNDVSSRAVPSSEEHLIPVEDLLAEAFDGTENGNFLEVIRSVVAVLPLLEDYSIDELMGLLGELNLLRGENQQAGELFHLLVSVVGDTKPGRVLSFLGELDSNDGLIAEARMSAFGALARKSLSEAIAYFEAAKWKGEEKDVAALAILGEMAKVDFHSALEFLRESPIANLDDSVITEMVMAALSIEAGNDAWRVQVRSALRSESEPRIQEMLAFMLARSSFQEGGVSELRDLFEELRVENRSASDQVVKSLVHSGGFSPSSEVMEWVMNEVPERDGKATVALAMRKWASADYEAAGKWLGEQKPSPMNDVVLASYAEAVLKLDPASAMLWAERISQEELRKKNSQKLLKRWQKQDPDAAQAWLEERDSGAEE